MTALRDNHEQVTAQGAQSGTQLVDLREANAALELSGESALSARGSEWLLLTQACGGQRALLVGITDIVALNYLARLYDDVLVWHDVDFDVKHWRRQFQVLGINIKLKMVASVEVARRLAGAAVGFDLIVVGDMLGGLVCGKPKNADSLVDAINKALQPKGQSFVLSTIAPSVLGVRRHVMHREWPTLGQLRKALLPMSVAHSYFLYREKRCPEEILGFDGVLPAGRGNRLAKILDMLGLISPLHNSLAVTGGNAVAACWLQAISDAAAEAAGFDSKPVIRRCLPRDNGTVTTMLQDSAGHHTVLRVPLSTSAESRLKYAWQSVSEMRSELEWLRPLTPEPLTRGVCAIWPYYLERQCAGNAASSLRGRRALDRLYRSIEAFLVKFAATGDQAQPLSESAYDEHCGSYIEVVAAYAPEAAGELKVMGRKLAAAMVGRTVPLVRVHGDFNPGNVLCDDQGSITGIIDWDACQSRGLPVQDLLHFLLRATSKLRSRQLGESIVGAVAGHQFSAGQQALVQRYCDALGIDPELKKPLFIIYWLRHICLHINYRSGPLAQDWLETNLHRPLRRLSEHYAS